MSLFQIVCPSLGLITPRNCCLSFKHSFCQEVAIVATHRNIPAKHSAFKLLKPHWLKTLSINAAARATSVPNVIVDLISMNRDQTYDFVDHALPEFRLDGPLHPQRFAESKIPKRRVGWREIPQLRIRKECDSAVGRSSELLYF